MSLMKVAPWVSVARDPSRNGCPGWYLPVRTHYSIGEKQIPVIGVTNPMYKT
jgi:hypothetical protein